jgi:predicted HAD superfamily phosphohydrolase YqeG
MHKVEKPLILPSKPVSPFLPEMDTSTGKEFCLVIDLDETLIHYDEE